MTKRVVLSDEGFEVFNKLSNPNYEPIHILDPNNRSSDWYHVHAYTTHLRKISQVNRSVKVFSAHTYEHILKKQTNQILNTNQTQKKLQPASGLV